MKSNTATEKQGTRSPSLAHCWVRMGVNCPRINTLWNINNRTSHREIVTLHRNKKENSAILRNIESLKAFLHSLGRATEYLKWHTFAKAASLCCCCFSVHTLFGNIDYPCAFVRKRATDVLQLRLGFTYSRCISAHWAKERVSLGPKTAKVVLFRETLFPLFSLTRRRGRDLQIIKTDTFVLKLFVTCWPNDRSSAETRALEMALYQG